MTKLNYLFIAAPINLVYTMDGGLLKLLLILIREQNEWLNRGDCQDGQFEYSIEQLERDMNVKRGKVKLILETLFDAELIHIIIPNKGKAIFNINWKKILILENSARNSIEYLKQKTDIKTFTYLDNNSEKHCKIWNEIDDYFTNFYGKTLKKNDIKNWKKCAKIDRLNLSKSVDTESFNSFQNQQKTVQIIDNRKEKKEKRNVECIYSIEEENKLAETIHTKDNKFKIINGGECNLVGVDNLPF